jgi:1-phosphofructokinase
MPGPRVVTVTLNPAVDQTLTIPGFAAGRVNRVVESWSVPGGKGVNVACILADLGIAVTATGFLGLDNRVLFEELFDLKKIHDRFVTLDGSTRIGLKIVDDLTDQTTDINFPGLVPPQEQIDHLFERISEEIEPSCWVVLSGSVPAGLPDDIYARLIDLIHGLGGQVMLDTSGQPLREALASRPEVVKPNVDELSELLGRPLATPEAVREAGESLLARGIGRVVVSMGGEGAVFLDGDRALLARPPKVTVRSTVGAGDAMVGVIVFGLIHEMPLDVLALLATASGAHAVTRLGAGIADLDELRELMKQVEIVALGQE